MTAWAHGQDAIVPGLAMLLEFVLAAVMVVVLIAQGVRMRQTIRGILQAGKFLGLFLGSAILVAALYEAAFHPEGLYPHSIPVGSTAGLIVAFFWYVVRGRRQQYAA